MAEIGYDGHLGDKVEEYICLDIPFDAFRIFGFLDYTGFKTCDPGIGSR